MRGHHLFKFDQDGYGKRDTVFGSAVGNDQERGELNNFLSQGNRAPDISPLYKFKFNNPRTDQINAIDVVHDFEWTHTPGHGRHEVPYVRMSEYRVNFNSLLQNIRFLLAGISAQKIGRLIGSELQSIIGDNVVGETVGGVAEGLGKGADKLSGKLFGEGQTAVGLQGARSVADYLKPYYGLYGASPTGFEYYIPYFEEDWKSVGTTWNNFSDGGGPLKGLYNDIFSREGFLRTVSSAALLSPNALGSYIERPKQYSYGDDGPAINVRFDLINTERQTDIIKNWQLVFMLLYQNLPNRTSKLLLEPPVIYEVEVPGKFYSPYAYIESLKVTNLGATRMMSIPYKIKNPNNIISRGKNTPGLDINNQQSQNITSRTAFNNDTVPYVPGSRLPGSDTDPNKKAEIYEPIGDGTDDLPGTKYVSTVIPDAFRIEITLRSLIPESKNFLFHSLLKDKTFTSGIFSSSDSAEMRYGINEAINLKRAEANQKNTIAANSEQLEKLANDPESGWMQHSIARFTLDNINNNEK